MINETIVTTVNKEGLPHVTPFGVWQEAAHIIIAPFKPSTTLANIILTESAAINFTDDVRVFAGAVTDRMAWPLAATDVIKGLRLANCLAHTELRLFALREDPIRPQLVMEVVNTANHQPFQGFNRAQAAVIELAVLVSRLQRLPRDKVMAEREYLQIAIDKTAGERELEAWHWLNEKIERYYSATTKSGRK